MGTTPASLSVLPTRGTSFGTSAPAATVTDVVPDVNIASFGTCSSPINPQVAAATAAAAGTLTPQPCLPATSARWTPGSKSVAAASGPALVSDACQCLCQWGGQIKVQVPGQTAVDVD